MLTYKQYIQNDSWFLVEGAKGKNLHLEHLEDEVLNGGIDGTRRSINYLQALRDMLAGNAEKKVNITTKWDGAPAIFAGINPENNKFFVGTKGVFAKNAKLNYTDADIEKNHPTEGLQAKLKSALKYLPSLGIKTVWQGDMMFTNDDISTENIDGTDYLIFQPNTIVYAVPLGTPLAKKILQAKMGIVWHTEYKGEELKNMEASFSINIRKLKDSENVWFRDADFQDTSGKATFTKGETDNITQMLSGAGKLFRRFTENIINTIANDPLLNMHIKAFNNTKIKEGESIRDTRIHANQAIEYINKKLQKNIDALKTERARTPKIEKKKQIIDFLRRNTKQLQYMFEMQNILAAAKLIIIRKLEEVKTLTDTFMKTPNGFKITAPEGFVAVDHLSGGALKLVDRMEFSRHNFTAQKDWTQ